MNRFFPLLMFVCLLAGCSSEEKKEIKATEKTKAPKSKSSSRAIRVDLGQLTPGLTPQGIGEPNEMANVIADEWEAMNPDHEIEHITIVVTGSGGDEWLKTQLIGGVAPEILQQNAEVTWQDVDKGWYVPLDEFLERPNPYVPGNKHWRDIFTNQALMDSKRAPDGKLYCISLDVVETGLFYNKDILREYGYEEFPETWHEMEEMLGKIKADHITPLAAGWGMESDWGMDIIFEQMYHDILPLMDLIPSRPDAQGYMGHYLQSQEAGFLYTKGFFSTRDPRWREMNRLLREWRNYWSKELKFADLTRLFLTERQAVYWTGSWFIRRMVSDPFIDFDWGIAYLPTITKETSPYGPGTPTTVIGGAATQLHVTNSALKNNNLEACIDYLMYLSAPKQIERIAGESLLYIPNVDGAKMDERLQPFKDIFQRKYCAMKWLESMDGKYKNYWRRMLDFYLNDGVGLDEYLEMLDQNFAEWVEHHRDDDGWNFEKMEKVWKERKAQLLNELEPRP